MKSRFTSLLKKIEYGFTICSLSYIIYASVKAGGILNLLSPEENYQNIFNGNELDLSNSEIEEIKNNLLTELENNIDFVNFEGLSEDMYFLLNAVYENDKLNEEEKRMLYELIYIILDNQFIDKENSYYTLRNLEYCAVEGNMEVSNSNVIARYRPASNTIEYNERNVSSIIISHENIHALFENYKFFSLFPSFLNEGVTELLNREYFGSDPFSYDNGEDDEKISFVYSYELAEVKILCELVGSSKVLEAYSMKDMSCIYDALSEIGGGKKKARSFIRKLADSNIIFDERGFLEDRSVFDEIKWYRDKAFEKDQSSFENIMSKEIIDFNTRILECMCQKNCSDKLIEDIYLEYGTMEKAYFNERLAKDSSGYFVPYCERLIYTDGWSKINIKK